MGVFVMHHVRPREGDEDVKLVGVYSTRTAAEAAAARLRKQPGFCDWAQGFQIEEYELDQDHWVEGFVTVCRPSADGPAQEDDDRSRPRGRPVR